MVSPFVRNDWYDPTVRPTPMKNRTPTPAKVVPIPVKFIESEQKSAAKEARIRSYSATAIQKVFRGFVVRKSVRKIAEIRGQVDDIAEKISKEGAVELMRRDSKEKLKVNEALMRLLFELDSVRGVDSGVRDFRKRVIKKAIALQETVDSISAEGNRVAGALGTLMSGGVESVEDAATVNECGEEIATERELGVKKERESGDVGSVGLLERVLEENKRMMEMMMGLYDRTETQTQLLGSLTDRVEEMERAFTCAQRLKRKKKRNADFNNRKYGKRA